MKPEYGGHQTRLAVCCNCDDYIVKLYNVCCVTVLAVCILQSRYDACVVERALFVFEIGFHPMFSLTQGTSQLPYKYAENR